MKIIILITTLVFSGCVTNLENKLTSDTKKTVIVEKPLPILAWGTTHLDWDKALYQAIEKSGLKSDVKTPCKKLTNKYCLAQLISIMAKYESSFKPETNFTESFKDSKGKPVTSRGLLQLSIESVNQKAYGCAVKQEKELNDPITNLQCGIAVIVYQSNKSGTLIDGNRGGCSAYWSVCRKSSKSYAKILNYLKDK